MVTNKIDWHALDALILEMAEFQQKKLLKCGRHIIPHLTSDDILQPNDFKELENHPVFRYEEGMLAGIHSVQMALRAVERDEKDGE